MSDPPDLQELARRYLALWQEQIAVSATDPELTQNIARLLALLGGGLAASQAFWQRGWAERGADATPGGAGEAADSRATAKENSAAHDRDNDGESNAAPAAGTAPAADASGGGAVELGQLDARLAALEDRLGRLEAGLGRARASPVRSPARRRIR